jgi:hypothetical protein
MISHIVFGDREFDDDYNNPERELTFALQHWKWFDVISCFDYVSDHFDCAMIRYRPRKTSDLFSFSDISYIDLGW